MNNKILLVYYSHTGRTARIAGLIAEAIDCDTESIKPITPLTGRHNDIRRQLAANPCTPVRELVHDINQYGTVILGMPVWDNDIPAPMTAFINSIDWRGITIHPFFSTGGVYVNVYSSLKDKCKGAAVRTPLYLIYDSNGNLSDVRE